MRWVTAVLLLSLTVAGCGNNAAEDHAAAEISQSLREGIIEMSQSQADCIAERIVSEIGLDQLVDYGILTDEHELASDIGNVRLDEGHAEAAAAAIVDCIEFEELVTKLIGDQQPEEIQGCVLEAISAEDIEGYLAALLAGASPPAEFADKIQGCSP